MVLNKIMVTAGVATLLQGTGQMIFAALCLAQYFCLIDFLRNLPLLLYIKILFFHNPDSCGSRINIGESIEGIANQAFVLINNLSAQAFRTFIINCTSLGLSVLWIITSVIIILGGAKNKQSKSMRWPWIIVTVIVCGVDLVASVIYANESFQTRTLNDAVSLIGGVVSGTSGADLDTSWSSWIMVLLYSRFVIFFLLNILLLILVIVSLNMVFETKADAVEVEAPPPVEEVRRVSAGAQVSTGTQVSTARRISSGVQESTARRVSNGVQVSIAHQVSAGVQSSPIPTPPLHTVTSIQGTSDRDEENGSVLSQGQPTTKIPRAGLSKSFQRMKSFLFRKSPSPEVHRRRSRESVGVSPEMSAYTHTHLDAKRTVNFPKSLLSLPQRLENIIAEQQRRLDNSVIDTSGRNSPPRASQSMPHLDTASIPPTDRRGRRGTTAELQGQLPWAYIPAPAHRMRDQLPPDEDLPPVPLPDYTALQPVKKASVHRAASSLSSLTQKKNYVASQSQRLPLNRSDVLY